MSTLLEQEIEQQGAVLRDRADAGMSAAADAAALLVNRDVEHLVIAARGSSDNVARFAQYLLGADARLLAGLAAPLLFRDPGRAPRLGRSAVIAISQSGRSPDIVGVATAARAQGRPTVVITGDQRSPLAEQADVVIPLLAGRERSVAATKTYLASLHAVVQLTEALAPDETRREWLRRIGDLVDETAAVMLADRVRFDPLATARLITMTGRGLAFATACESALKLRECSGIPAESFSPPDLLHGPIAALRPAGAAWLVEPGEEMHQIVARTGETVVLSADQRFLGAATIPVALPPRLPPWVSAVIGVLPAQAAALRLAELLKVDVDHPHGLQKVTLTQ
jgi:glutamine---fructose-6-phosphate transaminase (isomerizing)